MTSSTITEGTGMKFSTDKFLSHIPRPLGYGLYVHKIPEKIKYLIVYRPTA